MDARRAKTKATKISVVAVELWTVSCDPLNTFFCLLRRISEIKEKRNSSWKASFGASTTNETRLGPWIPKKSHDKEWTRRWRRDRNCLLKTSFCSKIFHVTFFRRQNTESKERSQSFQIEAFYEMRDRRRKTFFLLSVKGFDVKRTKRRSSCTQSASKTGFLTHNLMLFVVSCWTDQQLF